ncbi:MAG: M1 family metallopeptidase [Candidatus Delongbacteria bacterium]|nr:M1 family metallopeptidase [Candidatus Delongbacteria bacterium]
MKSPLAALLLICLPFLALAQSPAPEDSLLEGWYKNHLAGAQSRFVQLDGGERSDPSIDVRYAHLALSPSMSTGNLIGRAELLCESRMQGLSSLELDLAQPMLVDSVGADASSWNRMGDILHLLLTQPADSGEQITVMIAYSGMPASSGFGSWSLTNHAGTPILSTLSEPYGARSWWPCKDDPTDKLDSLRLEVTVPSAYTATSNGVLEGVDNLGINTRWRWVERYPIASYLVCLSVTNYVSFEDSYISMAGDTMPVVHYVYPEDLADAQIDFDVTVPMLEFFSQLWGEYPFVQEKYGHSAFAWSGGMEHQCNTSYGANLIRGDHVYDRIVAHELAHQWWGDLITCATFDDIWLNEGFATYSEALWTEHTGGFAALQNFMVTRAWVTDPSGPVYAPTSTFGSNTVYRKGAWLLHMLRGIIGDTAFTELMRGWYQSDHAYGSATVADFVAHAQTFTDKDLSGFWQGYLYGMNRPTYRWDVIPRTHQGFDLAQIWISQIQSDPDFEMYLPLRVNSGAGSVALSVRDSLRNQGFAVLTPAAPTTLEFDPDNWVLEFNTEGTLENQLSQIVFSGRFADGSLPGAGDLRATLRRPGDRHVILDATCMDHGIFVFELQHELEAWVPSETLTLDLYSLSGLHAGERLHLSIAPDSGLWQDLGLHTLQHAPPPLLSIELQDEVAHLQWTSVPGAQSYRIYRYSDLNRQDEILLGETPLLHWDDPIDREMAVYQVRVVWAH